MSTQPAPGARQRDYLEARSSFHNGRLPSLHRRAGVMWEAVEQAQILGIESSTLEQLAEQTDELVAHTVVAILAIRAELDEGDTPA